MIVRPDEISASSAPSTSPLKHCETKLPQLITIPFRACPLSSCLTSRPASTLFSSRHIARVTTGTGNGWGLQPFRRPAVTPSPPGGRAASFTSGIVAQVAAERIRLLHQRLTRNDLENFPEIFLVLHILWRLASDNDDRADALMILGAIMHVAHQRRNGLALLIGLDDIRWIESACLVDHPRPVREADIGVLRAPDRK